MILNETTAMFNGQLLFDRPMHVKMVSMFKFFLLFELIVVPLILDDVWFQSWVKIQGGDVWETCRSPSDVNSCRQGRLILIVLLKGNRKYSEGSFSF